MCQPFLMPEHDAMTARKKTSKKAAKPTSKKLATNRALFKVFSVRSSPPARMSVDS